MNSKKRELKRELERERVFRGLRSNYLQVPVIVSAGCAVMFACLQARGTNVKRGKYPRCGRRNGNDQFDALIAGLLMFGLERDSCMGGGKTSLHHDQKWMKMSRGVVSASVPEERRGVRGQERWL